MSSLLDTILQSESGPPQGARRGIVPQSDAPPSSRPNLPSESNAQMSEAPEFADDQVVGPGGSIPRRTRHPMYGRGPPTFRDVAGEKVQQAFEELLETHMEDPMSSGAPPSSEMLSDKYYVSQIHGMAKLQLSTLYVDFTHLTSLPNQVLADAIANQYYRFHPYLTKALHNLIAKYEPQYFREHRQLGSHSSQASTSAMAVDSSEPDRLSEKTRYQQTDKVFSLAFYNLPLVSRLRQLRTAQIGKLLSISGTVTRTSEVRPELAMGTFTCESCNTPCPDIEQSFKYTEPALCPNPTCGNRVGWRLDIRRSTFIDWQKVKLQESSHEIPTGSMPRTMDVILRGEMVDRAKAGERCIFTGTLIVIPDISQLGLPGIRPEASRDYGNTRGGDVGGSGVTGLKSLGVRDLTYRLAFLACMVTPDLTTPGQPTSQSLTGHSQNILASLNQVDLPEEVEDMAQERLLQTFTPKEVEELKELVHTKYIYSKLVDSIAPMIYGHRSIKKGLLLQLVGGVTKKTVEEGMQLRGDINICIVGDPSTSKSQFLKYICSLHPRAVYTSGKASSAAGLTASVVKDPETGEFTIEAGALMLANGGGICAIDEFDKMDISDQVAIHEAMEQQTISIAKAGIHTTLNARASILAAANPVGGRYNPKATLRANLNFSAPIMSRFDLFFVIRDDPNEAVDRNLAEHIVNVHMNRDEAVEPEIPTEMLQRYIRFARTFRPVFTPEAKELVVEKYMELRNDDAQGGIGRSSYRITVRQLESLIRLSEAVAKANCVEEVVPHFVLEAYNLLRQSIVTVEKDDIEVDDEVTTGNQDHEMFDGDNEQRDHEGDTAMGTTEDVMNADSAAQQQQSQKTKITYDKYMKILNLLVRRINEDEANTGEGVEEEDLKLWYLEQIESELNSEDDVERERSLATKVLKRMVKDNILMQIRGEGLVDASNSMQDNTQDRVVYVLHPNCAVEEM
ncbi:DNA replication licensing factor mcm6, putative [Coccidioides posadasii C735 delta SOWgp]|uniref:DNA replication licensing factor MCM6 n=1 Tax=Coccidioides posadasii (strain C735) TaxID=222929 RepID=C5PI42_COCP7|nr:DNA replication licensing factor mcm6, putative [Coccidioides posadasii C735 delta SOWgp]EER24195.1 DNA replication licensing factor mcm6, putative [Coccidioides posadasii C735 delta SOWgp]|eukprot:XP_003066340.1 DNA replication licensing factor mcm6, putative [Coccidioides posadasii C735 delta SOWgp]